MALRLLCLLSTLPIYISAEEPDGFPQYDSSLIHNIVDYGAVANTSSKDLNISRRNGKALFDAVQAAHNSPVDGARTVVIPAYSNFAFMPYKALVGLYNITISLDGTLNFYEGNMHDWTQKPTEEGQPQGMPLEGITIDKSSYITLTSNMPQGGNIQGNGHRWWWEDIRRGIERPNLMAVTNCLYVVLEKWNMFSSPRWTVNFRDDAHAIIQNCTIQVDLNSQKEMLETSGNLDHGTGLPILPLNTDGFDVAGKNITIRHCHVDNWDDAYCAKPLHKGSNVSDCTTDIVFEDSTITNGVGASVGSVPPNPNVNCIANTTFRRIRFRHPIKAIYVKPNPCPNGPKVDGTGIIHNITYEDIYAYKPLTWPVYVGTQQQKQPHSKVNTGCDFLFPLPGTHCPTNGCVPVTDLKLRNVYMEDALWAPGLLRCNETGPCTGWEFTNVTIKSRSRFPSGTRDNFICHAIKDYKFTNVSVGCKEEKIFGLDNDSSRP